MNPVTGSDLNSEKCSANLRVNAALLREAKALGLNLSKTFEASLEQKIREVKRLQWLERNREAIEIYNQRIRTEGVFSDGLRRF